MEILGPEGAAALVLYISSSRYSLRAFKPETAVAAADDGAREKKSRSFHCKMRSEMAYPTTNTTYSYPICTVRPDLRDVVSEMMTSTCPLVQADG